MHYFTILLVLLFCYSTTINSRPAQLQEENDSETVGSEYESDDAADDEYLQEDRQPVMDEVPQKANQDGAMEDSQEPELIQDPKLGENKRFDNNKEGYEMFAENESNVKKEANDDAVDLTYDRGESFSSVKENPKIYVGSASSESGAEGSQSRRINFPKNNLEPRNVVESSGEHLASDYSESSLFQRYHDHVKNEKSDHINGAVNEKEYKLKQPTGYNRISENNVVKNYDYTYYVDRSRRQVENLDEKPITDINSIQNDNNNLDITNENAILKNIKKLSDQDLEDLLNSLPEDKKAILKRIMDKREITKKAGAIEDNSFVESDTSKVEGSFSANSNSVSSVSSNSDSTETSKNVESGEGTSLKISDSESESRKSVSKSGEIIDTSTTSETLENTNIYSKCEANIISNNKDASKNENKRETNKNDFLHKNVQEENSKYSELQDKSYNDFSMSKECSEIEDLYETKNEEINPHERELPKIGSSDLSASVEKLEDSFPSGDAFKDTESDMEPLIRVKRTDLHHRVKKRDLPFLANDNLSFITDIENEGSENIEGSEFNDREFIDSKSNFAIKERYIKLDSEPLLHATEKNPHSCHRDTTSSSLNLNSTNIEVVSKTDTVDLGSDSDCILLGIEGVDDNLMLDSGHRAKRNQNSDEILEGNSINHVVNLNLSSCATNTIQNESLMSDNGKDKPHHGIGEAIGLLSQDPEEVGRYKRIKRLKNASYSPKNYDEISI